MLDRLVQVTPQGLAHAKTQKIANAIKVAGLHRQKAKALKDLARIIAKQDPNFLTNILKGPLETARSSLQLLPKVGPKTADVLLTVWGLPTISVDTHVDRVSKRLGLAPQKARYEQVRSALMQLFAKQDYPSVPLQFIAHGRQICKAVAPQCSKCPVEALCPFPRKDNQSTKPFLT
jgi:endonuclease-3